MTKLAERSFPLAAQLPSSDLRLQTIIDTITLLDCGVWTTSILMESTSL